MQVQLEFHQQIYHCKLLEKEFFLLLSLNDKLNRCMLSNDAMFVNTDFGTGELQLFLFSNLTDFLYNS